MTKILRARDVAERLGCNVTTVYRWASSGSFPKQIRLSSACVGWREDEIESWIEGRERGAHLNPGNIKRRATRESGRKGAGA
jgi:prophage regulatory protein